jgi:hypothetical protein
MKVETNVYLRNIRKKYKLSFVSPYLLLSNDAL